MGNFEAGISEILKIDQNKAAGVIAGNTDGGGGEGKEETEEDKEEQKEKEEREEEEA